jgi:hypothetical protein
MHASDRVLPLALLALLILCVAVYYGQRERPPPYSPCAPGETLLNGNCYCGSLPPCDGDLTCQGGICACGPESLICQATETCVSGECQCAGEVCGYQRSCWAGSCLPVCDPLAGQCGAGEVCSAVFDEGPGGGVCTPAG